MTPALHSTAQGVKRGGNALLNGLKQTEQLSG